MKIISPKSNLWPFLVLALTVFALMLSFAMFGKHTGNVNTARVASSGKALIGGHFQLTTHDGKRLSDVDLNGTPYVAFFGFTHCPDVCPTALWNLSELLKSLGPDGDKLKVLLISVDPERDTPEVLATYLQSFDSRIIGLTGTEDQIAETAKAFRAFVRKVPLKDGGFTFDHTATIYLMDRKGEFFSALDIHEPEEARLAKLRRLITNG